MADTRCQTECERWIRDHWLRERFGQDFTERNVALSSGGYFKFDAVSADGTVVASISTSKKDMRSGKAGVGKFMKLRSDMLFHILAGASRKLMIFTESCMFEACIKERERGRTPRDIEFIHAQLPDQPVGRLAASRETSSREVRPSKTLRPTV